MALFCVTFSRDSISLLKFPFLSHVQEFTSLSLEISIELFSYPFLFSGYFCSVDACVVCIFSGGNNQSSSVLVYVIFESLYRYINVTWLQANPLPLSFFDICSLSVSSLGCKAWCIVINFFVPWSLCWSSSLVHFKSDPEYLTRETVMLFIPLMRFLLCSLVSSSFLVLRGYSFLFLFHHRIFGGVRFQYFQVFVRFLFSQRSDFLLI